MHALISRDKYISLSAVVLANIPYTHDHMKPLQ
jgi:hypothetical protein